MAIKQLAEDLELEENECKELLELFIETGMSDINQMKSAMGEGDTTKIMFAAHSLKGAAGNFNFIDLSVTAAEIEKNAHRNKLETMLESITILENMLNEVAFFFSLEHKMSPTDGRY